MAKATVHNSVAAFILLHCSYYLLSFSFDLVKLRPWHYPSNSIVSYLYLFALIIFLFGNDIRFLRVSCFYCVSFGSRKFLPKKFEICLISDILVILLTLTCLMTSCFVQYISTKTLSMYFSFFYRWKTVNSTTPGMPKTNQK